MKVRTPVLMLLSVPELLEELVKNVVLEPCF